MTASSISICTAGTRSRARVIAIRMSWAQSSNRQTSCSSIRISFIRKRARVRQRSWFQLRPTRLPKSSSATPELKPTRTRCAWRAWRRAAKTSSRSRGGFHGRTADAISATFLGKYRELGKPNVPGHLEAEFGDIESVRALADESVAAIMLEPIQSMAGVRMAEASVLSGVARACDERGIVLIYDEVQTGVGRTGEWFFAGSEGGRRSDAGHHHAGKGARQRHSGGRVSGHRKNRFAHQRK